MLLAKLWPQCILLNPCMQGHGLMQIQQFLVKHWRDTCILAIDVGAWVWVALSTSICTNMCFYLEISARWKSIVAIGCRTVSQIGVIEGFGYLFQSSTLISILTVFNDTIHKLSGMASNPEFCGGKKQLRAIQTTLYRYCHLYKNPLFLLTLLPNPSICNHQI